MNILITGSSGYVGSSLVPYLLAKGHIIRGIDTQWFGCNLIQHKNLEIIKKDIRAIELIDFDNIDSVIHLANIANDPGVELNPSLSWEVNVLTSQKIAELSIKSGVKQIIYASSGSVYGVKDEPEVTEDLDLIPISVYNKTKMVSERVFLSYNDKIKIHNIRPATICGWSPRMRLDVSVNMLTYQALTNQKITVFGGAQVRPNIHMQDMIKVYDHFLKEQKKIISGNYNAGFENISILNIAEMVKEKVETDIEITPSNDPRSYRQNSDKLIETGFIKSFGVSNAIDEIIQKYKNGELLENENSFTVKKMRALGLDT
tara:strand:+ start:11471 stop:12418 length:948 start_codon:yes stop_codon:yes gene_type:complete